MCKSNIQVMCYIKLRIIDSFKLIHQDGFGWYKIYDVYIDMYKNYLVIPAGVENTKVENTSVASSIRYLSRL